MHAPACDLHLETARLLIEPVVVAHAEHMFGLLQDSELYRYIPFDPPSIDQLRRRYERWEARISPGQDEIWLNWVIRLKLDQTYIGDLQAGYKTDHVSSVAYMIGSAHQGHGYAHEGLHAVIKLLFDRLGMQSVKAWIDTRNAPSIALVKSLRLSCIDTIKQADHFKDADSNEYVFEITRQMWKKGSQ